MVTTPSILISGASVAGPTLAHWLAGAGWDVTVIERVDRLRDEGQNVDVRGAGREVLRRMGIEDAVRAAHTHETGLDFVDEHGRPVASFAAGTDDTSGTTAELEILRGQLGHILYDLSSADSAYVFGDQITGLHDDGHGVDVEFLHAPARRFDAVVVAEGLRSRTRTRVLGDAPVRELGVYNAYLTIPRTDADNDRWRWLIADRGRGVALRPDNVGTTRASLNMRSSVRGVDRLDREDVVTILRATFADIGWEVPRILSALDDCPLYFESLGQARLPHWSRGRIAVLGDAAYCASPFSGMGTTLALTGAYILAGELTSHAEPQAAFARYEAIMRPFVEKAQQLSPGLPNLFYPGTRLQRSLIWAGLRATASPLANRLGGLQAMLFSPPADALDLPEYALTPRKDA
ncbi:FAD-dependent monooxygenase [Streptomyces sp. MMG1121]|uniref:FAD-dependent monooxygenase n=1 Tax=Streptomyces sp. MMG1121 TaxID=1415544 RepID=UPI0006AFBDBB|nr:FAD-dependent monooxygenase [Streptomyces sp. MMG1121]KOV60419.1 FAD-binding monooxygenase [Streptomyces sp. MMG1121]